MQLALTTTIMEVGRPRTPVVKTTRFVCKRIIVSFVNCKLGAMSNVMSLSPYMHKLEHLELVSAPVIVPAEGSYD